MIVGNKWQKRRRHNEGERSGQAEFDQPRDPGRGSRDVLECQWEGRDVHAGEVGGMEGGVGVNVCLKMGLLAPECLLESPDTYDIVPPYVFWRACWHMPPPPGVGCPPPLPITHPHLPRDRLPFAGLGLAMVMRLGSWGTGRLSKAAGTRTPTERHVGGGKGGVGFF